MITDLTIDEAQDQSNNNLIANPCSKDMTVMNELSSHSIFGSASNSIAAIYRNTTTQSTNDVEAQTIQMPITPIHDLSVVESSRCFTFQLTLAISMLPPSLFGFFGVLGSYALEAVGVELGEDEPDSVILPTLIGGIPLAPFLYAGYLLVVSQEENCTALYERAVERSALFKQLTDLDSKIGASFAILLSYSLLLSYSITAGIVGDFILENLPHSQYDGNMLQVILTIILGSGLYVAYGATMLSSVLCLIQASSVETLVEISNDPEPPTPRW